MNKEFNKFYLIEMNELMLGLAKRGIDFNFSQIFDGFKIAVPSQGWDAICHGNSYGCRSALLEVMGSAVVRVDYDDVEGYLTAQEILNRIDEKS